MLLIYVSSRWSKVISCEYHLLSFSFSFFFGWKGIAIQYRLYICNYIEFGLFYDTRHDSKAFLLGNKVYKRDAVSEPSISKT